MEKKFTGLIISVTDNEKVEKIVSILTLEEGLVNLAVQNPKDNETFKFAKEIFTFAFFSVKKIGDFFYDLRKCEVIETFDNIKKNEKKFAEGQNLLLATKEIVQYDSKEIDILYELLKALKTLNYTSNLQQDVVLTKYLTTIFFKFTTKNLKLTNCTCGENISQVAWFDFEANKFVCSRCRGKYTIKFTKSSLNNLALLNKTDYQELQSINILNLDNLLQNLKDIFKFKVGERIKFYCG